ncbi:hypothetical protein MAR_005992 [Mya arenaria]|uniref:Integrase core domain-containing protein n=1 Tax=Mya arenaria TaxID=6604 RepID=A0ABY7D8U6_MYAAR|nr:hypothetical protein MAR_005992 [Mya arenaria]
MRNAYFRVSSLMVRRYCYQIPTSEILQSHLTGFFTAIRIQNDAHEVRSKWLLCHARDNQRTLEHFYPNGIKHRQQRRLQRRVYLNLGPNYLWHIDGYDKLKPFGICIHDATDGFLRYVLWLEAYQTNNDPKLISGYYTETVPMISSFFTRMGNMTMFQILLIKIEEFCLRRESNPQTLHGEIKRWPTRLRRPELDEVRQLWNCHRIIPVRNNIIPSGRPVTMHTCPELYCAQDYLCAVRRANVDSCLEECVLKHRMRRADSVSGPCPLGSHISKEHVDTDGRMVMLSSCM